MESQNEAVVRLLTYCHQDGWEGYDPYDALNSRLFQSLPFLNFRMFRIGLTQLLKRAPLNIRPMLLIPKTCNPKAVALFLSSILKLSKLGLLRESGLAQVMIDKLVELRSPDTSYWCWGYSFPWQTRTIIVSRGAPNLVCTTFAANALLDAYEQFNDSRCLAMATSAAEYILNDLYWTQNATRASFSYPLPTQREPIHNANLLGAALLCRVYKCTGEDKFLKPALRVARYSARQQHEDGSWPYGELRTQQWVDNFHTGYNLCALRSISDSIGTSEFVPNVEQGFRFYRDHFFLDDGTPKYFHDRVYPIDVHCVAQSIITLTDLEDLDKSNMELADCVCRWAMTNLWDKRGYFYYRMLRVGKIRISYMRWSQAWMLLALATFLEHKNQSRAA